MSDKYLSRLLDLVLPFLIVTSVFGIQMFWVSTFDFFIILQESLIIDQVFESLPDLLDVDILILAHLLVDVSLALDRILVEESEAKDFVLARWSITARLGRLERLCVLIVLYSSLCGERLIW